MYKRYAVKFHQKQREFVNCVNMVERIKKARALPQGIEHLGVKRYVVSTSEIGKKKYITIRDCE